MVNLRVLIVISVAALVGCDKDGSLPSELMYKGQPIDPAVVVGTQFGDSSRYELKDLGQLEEIRELELSEDGKVVSFRQYYESFSGFEHYLHDEYEYCGSYGDKHVVLTNHYDSNSTGRFSELGLVKRVGDCLVNCGDIAAGDRFQGGVIRIDGIEGRLLKYSSCLTADGVCSVMKYRWRERLPLEDLMTDWPNSGCLWVNFVVDLEDPALESKFNGVTLDERMRDSARTSFDRVGGQYIERGQKELDVEEAREYLMVVVKDFLEYED